MSTRIEPPHKRSFWLTGRGEALVTGLLALPAAFWAVWQKWYAAPAPAVDAVNALLNDPVVTKSATLPGARLGLKDLASGSGGLSLAIFTLIGVLLLAYYKYRLALEKDLDAAHSRDPHHLMGPLFMLYEAVKRRKGLQPSPEDERFRVTLHRVEGDYHVQHLPYVGFKADDPLKQPGRRWENRCGLVGDAVREGGDPTEVLVAEMEAHVNDPKSYEKALMKLYKYNAKEAKDHEYGRMSSLVLPINGGSRNDVIAVLYADSSERDFFDEEIRSLCIVAGMAVARCVQLMKK